MDLHVSLAKFDDQLMCAGCGGNSGVSYLHHRCVEVHERAEDEEYVRLTRVRGSSVTSELVPSKGSGNPSDRRNGVRIAFDCELCQRKYWLNFAQHKGQTFIYWTPILEEPPTLSASSG
jgi:hypothetical protein